MSIAPLTMATTPQGDRWCFYAAPAASSAPLLARLVPAGQPEDSCPLEPVNVPGGYLRHLVATVDAQGQPHLAFQRWSAAPLHPRWEVWFASRDQQGQWPAETVDTQVSANEPMQLVVTPHGVHLAYLDGHSRELRYAQRSGTGWQIEIVSTVATGGTFELAVHSAAEIVFLEANLFLVRASASPTEWHFQVLQDEADPNIVIPHPRWSPPATRQRHILEVT